MSDYKCKRCGTRIFSGWFNQKESNGTGKPGFCQRCSLSKLSERRGKKK